MVVDKQMIHLNSNALCALFIEHTNKNPRQGDIIQICVMLLDNFALPSRNLIPFYQDIAPFRPENIDFDTASLSREKIAYCKINGVEPTMAADRFEEWYNELDLPAGKKIIPVVHNWPFISEYLHTWLGYHNYNHLFGEQYRDIMSMAMYLNDMTNNRGEKFRFPKTVLTYLGNQLGIEIFNKSDVMEKTLKVAEMYKALIQTNSYL